jgi:hypothetical protein
LSFEGIVLFLDNYDELPDIKKTMCAPFDYFISLAMPVSYSQQSACQVIMLTACLIIAPPG